MFAAVFTPTQVAAAAVTVTDAKTGVAAVDAVISLVAIDSAASATRSEGTIRIVQKNKEFTPQITAVAVGTTVEFSNEELKGKHHIYSLSAPKKFEIPLHDPGNRQPVVFDKPGVVALGCNIHDWMRAYVIVVDTPYFAKTGETGKAEFDVPPGRYRAEVWHARLKKVHSRDVTLPSPAPIAFALALEPEQRIRRGPTAIGGGYK